MNYTQPILKQTRLVVVCALVLMLVAACSNMERQPKLHDPYSESPTFGMAARYILPEAVPVGYLREDEHFYFGTINGEPAESFPMELTQNMVMRGKQLYEAFCAPCHGYSGYGDGSIVQKGFQRPNSFHISQVRNAPDGHFYQVITEGQGGMFSYASRVEPADRWAIVAYIRALQISQNAVYADLPADIKAEFDASAASTE